MALFVFVGCGTAAAVGCADVAGKLEVALAFGFGITVLAYTVGAHSGGQINCAVTFGLLIASQLGVANVISAPQAAANFAAQMVGAIAGGGLVAVVFSKETDQTKGLGSNALGEGVTTISAFVGEVLGTFLLMYVVLETAVNKMSLANRMTAPIAIGLAVFLAHGVLIEIDGCSINPTRSFGPALVASIRHSGDEKFLENIWSPMWIFWVGPLLGASLAVCCYKLVNAEVPSEDGEGGEVPLKHGSIVGEGDRLGASEDCLESGAASVQPQPAPNGNHSGASSAKSPPPATALGATTEQWLKQTGQSGATPRLEHG